MGKIACISVAAGLFLLGAALLTAGLVVDLSVFPSIVHNTMPSQKVLGLNSDGTFNDFTKEWAFPNYISSMNYWTFDYKNTIGVMNRAIYPDVIEKGPYAYKETLINDDIVFSKDGETMTFSQATRYNFDKDNSCPTCDPYTDVVTVPDISFGIVMNAIEAQLESIRENQNITDRFNLTCLTLFNKVPFCNKVETKLVDIFNTIEHEIGTLMDMYDVSPFVTVTVDQLLFSGYTAPLLTKFVDKSIDIINLAFLGPDLYNNQTLIYKHPNASLAQVALNSENGTTDFIYTVDTGKRDYQKSGYTLSFVNKTELGVSSDGNSLPPQWWPTAGTDGCDGTNGNLTLSIDGTNADYFKSFISKSEKLPIYVDDLCRTVHLTYDREVNVKGIDGYRFVLPSSEFDYSRKENCGFCNPLTNGAYNLPVGSPCLPSGLLDISQCQQGSPILISKPHFYQADNIVTSFVPRFIPTYEQDETTIDVEPITGSVLAANKKLQINMLVNQYPRIGAYSVMRPGAYPLVWLNESFLIDDGTVNQLNSQLFTPQKIIDIICWTAVGVGVALMVVSVVILFIQFCVAKTPEKKDN